MAAEPVERVASGGDGNPAAEVVAGNLGGARDDLAHPPADELSEDDSADQAEQDRDDERDEQRALERLAQGEAVADGAGADQPFAMRKAMGDDGRLAGRGLVLEAEERRLISFAQGAVDGRQSGEVAEHL